MAMIPLGYRFMPTDEELITCYLLRRAMGLPLIPSGADHQHIVEKHLYGDQADPCHVFQDVDDSHWDISEGEDFKKDTRVIYVVTNLSKVSKGKTRIARRAGCGTWSGQTAPKRIYNQSGQWVGSKRMLPFKRSPDVDGVVIRVKYHWIMHEYSLDGIYSITNNCQIKHHDYVICRITRVFDKTDCLPPLQQEKKNRSSSQVDADDKGEDEIAPRDKKQKNAIVVHQQPAGQSMQPPDHQFLVDQMACAELPLPCPGSIEGWINEALPLPSPGSIEEWTDEALNELYVDLDE